MSTSERKVVHKHPPKFIKGSSYKAWKNKIAIWTPISGYEKVDQALVVRLESFVQHPEAERACETLEVGKLQVEDGMAVLLKELDSVFLEEELSEKWVTFLDL